MKNLAIAAVLSIAVATVPACDTPTTEDIAAHKAEVAAMIDMAKVAQASPEATDESKASAAAVQAKLEDIYKGLATIEYRLENPSTQESDADRIAQGISSVLPPPWDLLAGLGVGGITMFLRSRKWSGAFKDLVAGIDKVKASSPEFAAALSANKNVLKSVLDSDVQALITRNRV